MQDEPTIGSLRWRVTLLRRPQAPEVNGPGITETEVPIIDCWADIQPTGAMTFYGSTQVDTPVTHRITIRWRAGLDMTTAVKRLTRGPDGVERTEIFRIRRQMDRQGRKRWLILEAELERQA